MDTRVMRRGKVHFHQDDVAEFVPAPADRFDAILSDLNGPAVDSMRQVVRLSAFLRPGGLVVFTLKTLANPSVVEMLRLRDAVATLAEKGRLQMLAETHLTYNRHEFTQFFVKRR
jgi:23S rRNA (cytidine2498-2'-O)-methyltransferase